MGCLTNLLRLVFGMFLKRLVERLVEAIVERLTGGGRGTPIWLAIFLAILAFLGFRIKPRT